jgi:apolipoprotein N-acyltransferase
VPFGEFLPLRSFIPKAWQTPVGDTDFSRGQGRVNLTLEGLPLVRPMICYEVIFPEWGDNVIDQGDEGQPGRPEWFLSVTNDAWFGISTGPYQHFHMARMRAAEQGIPMVRAANTGISGVVDAYGRVDAQLPLGTQAIIDVKIPKSLQNTPYSMYNYAIISVIILIAIVLLLI